MLAWRRLVQQSGKTPWELTQADIEGHAAWMEAEGYSPATIGCALGIFSNFYRWCGERGVEAECQYLPRRLTSFIHKNPSCPFIRMFFIGNFEAA